MHNTMMQCFAERDSCAQQFEVKCRAMEELQDDITVRELVTSSYVQLYISHSLSVCFQGRFQIFRAQSGYPLRTYLQ